jgi:hypothetical protein
MDWGEWEWRETRWFGDGSKRHAGKQFISAFCQQQLFSVQELPKAEQEKQK